ncbi:MAG: hypothetical protein KDK33_19100, partial [Leptospiraceae bacterium]|nr:hypothetical protein [Leptospiraceae bacterium]
AGFLLVGNSDASLQSNVLTRVQAQNAKKYMRKYDTALWMIGGIYALNLWDISIEGGVRTYLSARPSLEGLRFGVVFLF